MNLCNMCNGIVEEMRRERREMVEEKRRGERK